MASSLDYAFTCQVCFEEFEETGDHIPRLLPCTHTLCETCISQMVQKDILVCPECRQKHPATRGKKSFPQNKYILLIVTKNLQMKSAVPQDSSHLCVKHNRQRSLYCKEPTCQQLICPLCLKDEHRNHDFDEAQQLLEEKRSVLLKHTEVLRQKLVSDKEKLAELKKDAKKNIEECTKKIQNDKLQQINAVTNTMTRFYDAMIADVNYSLKEVNTQIDDDSVDIEENLGLLADIEESSKIVTSVDDIVEIMSTVNLVTENAIKFSGVKMYKNYYHQGYGWAFGDIFNIQKLVGTVESKENPVVFSEPPLKLSLQPKTVPALKKAIGNASELEFEGK